MSNPKIVRRDRRRRERSQDGPALTMADYYRQLLASPGCTTAPTFCDYERAAGLD